MVSDNHNYLEKFELILNVFNHVLIGFVSIYMTWYSIAMGLTTIPLHAWLCTLGYQFLLAEGILTLYSANVWTYLYAVKTKRHIHWVLQVMGSALGLAGAILMIKNKKGKHFTSIHGILGLTSSILLLVNLLTGVFAFFSIRVKQLIRPIVLKTLHIFFGFCGFVLGMVTMYYGIIKLEHYVDYSFAVMLSIFSLITLVLTLFGTFKSLFRNLGAMCTN